MNTQKTANQICREKVDTICAQHGITLIFSGSGDYTNRAHATWTYDGGGIDLFVYPNGNYPSSKYHYYKVTAN